MGSSILSEVDDTSILRTGLSTCYWHPLDWLPASRLLPPRSGLERSDFVLWPEATQNDVCSHVGFEGLKRKCFEQDQSDARDPRRTTVGPCCPCEKGLLLRCCADTYIEGDSAATFANSSGG